MLRGQNRVTKDAKCSEKDVVFEKKAFKEAEEWQEQKTQTQSKEYKKDSGIKARGGILRYPLESLTQDTDYLQIDIVEYKSSKQLTGSVVGSAGTRSLGAAKNVGGTTSGALAKKGRFLRRSIYSSKVIEASLLKE